MNVDKLNKALPPGFTARFWDGEKYHKEYRIYINYGKRGRVGNFIIFPDGKFQRNAFDHEYGFENIKTIDEAFVEWWESQ